MLTEKRWNVHAANTAEAERLATRLGITPIAAQLLINRGMDDAEHARTFLNPQLSDLHDPALLPEFGHAAERIVQRIAEHFENETR